MASRSIDYDALARQAGAISNEGPSTQTQQIGYDALAEQAGAISSSQHMPQKGDIITGDDPEHYEVYRPSTGEHFPLNANGSTTQNQQRSWLDSASDFASELWNQVNPVAGVKGLVEATNHPIRTLAADNTARQAVARKAEEAFKRGDYAGGLAHALYSIVPLLGPQLSRSGEQFQSGEYAKGLGSSIGMGVSLAAPAALKNANIRLPGKLAQAARAEATDLYQSALKPSTTMNATKKASAVQTGLDNAIPVSKEGLDKIGELIDELNSQIAAAIPANSTQTVSKFRVASRLGDTSKRFAKQVNPESDLAAVSDAGNEFLRNQPARIPAAEAQALKQGTYQQLKGRAYGELKSASIESQKALARGIKEELARQFPELSNLNAREAKLLDLQPVLERAVNRIGNHQLMGIGTPAVGGAVGAVTKSGKLAAAAGLIKLTLDNPVVKSRLAIALNRAGKAQGITLPIARMRVQAYASILGNVLNSTLSPQPAPAQP